MMHSLKLNCVHVTAFSYDFSQEMVTSEELGDGYVAFNQISPESEFLSC